MTPKEIALKCAETCERADVNSLAEASRRIRSFALTLSAAPEEREPDGFAVVLDDKASSPKGYWFAYAYIDRETAEKSATLTKGRVAPIYFAPSPQRTFPSPGEGNGKGMP